MEKLNEKDNCEMCNAPGCREKMLVVNDDLWLLIYSNLKDRKSNPGKTLLCPECIALLLGREIEPSDIVCVNSGISMVVPANIWFLNEHKDWVDKLRDPILNNILVYGKDLWIKRGGDWILEKIGVD